MDKIKNFYKKTFTFFQKDHISEIVFALMGVITFFGWVFNYSIGFALLFSFASLIMLVSFDTKYGLVAGLFTIFMMSDKFVISGYPMEMVIPIAIYGIILIVFTLMKDFRLFCWQQTAVLFFMGFINWLPILWNKFSEFPVTYILYFNWFLYFILYIVFCNILKGNNLIMMCRVFCYIILVLTAQCIYMTITTLIANNHLEWYTLGWGICNEAAIMLLMFLPFMLVDIRNTKGYYLFVRVFCILVGCVAVLATYSRGGYLFLAFEVICVLLFMIRKHFKNRVFIIRLVCMTTIILMFGFVYRDELVDFLMSKVFTNGFDSSGRFELYKDAIYHFTKSWRNRVFGSGIATEVMYSRVIVYHSTFFETIVCGGLLGLAGFLIHLYYKYKALYDNRKIKGMFFVFLSLFATSVYGYIDNTYHMYYYMIFLVAIMAMVENLLYSNKQIINN